MWNLKRKVKGRNLEVIISAKAYGSEICEIVKIANAIQKDNPQAVVRVKVVFRD